MHLQLISDWIIIPLKHSSGPIYEYTINIPAFSVMRLKSTQAVPFIHMHSGKTYNPVSSERAQVTPLTAPRPLLFGLEPPIILLFDILKEMYKKKRKSLMNSEYETFVSLIVDFWHDPEPAVPLRCGLSFFVFFHWHQCDIDNVHRIVNFISRQNLVLSRL